MKEKKYKVYCSRERLQSFLVCGENSGSHARGYKAVSKKSKVVDKKGKQPEPTVNEMIMTMTMLMMLMLKCVTIQSLNLVRPCANMKAYAMLVVFQICPLACEISQY